MRRLASTGGGCWVAAFALLVPIGGPAGCLAATPFKAGERVCFVGDSITYGKAFCRDVALFHACRYPDRKLYVFNCGVGGSRTRKVLERLEWDILVNRPDVLVVMLGMNETGVLGAVAQNRKGKRKRKIDVAARTAEAAQEFREKMVALIGKLNTDGRRVVLMSSSPYDATAQIEKEPIVGVQEQLELQEAFLRECSQKYNTDFIPLNTFMHELNLRGQQRDPVFSLIGPDRVHPNHTGSFVIAYRILKSQHHSPFVSKLCVDARARKVVETVNCTATLERGRGLVVEVLEKALPFPVSRGYSNALHVVPFMAELNQQLLQVRNLAPGSYELLIDGASILSSSHTAFGRGINLASQTNTPQYVQAREVYQLVKRRDARERETLRAMAATLENLVYWDARKYKFDLSDYDAVKKYLEGGKMKKLIKRKRPMAEGYIAYWPQRDQVRQELDAMTDRIYAAAQPRKHVTEIRRK